MTDTQPIRLTEAGRFTVGGVTVTPAARTITGASERVIEPRVMQVLVALHRHDGEVVGREALIDACWDGRTVGEDAINRAILKLRRALDEVGGTLVVETVAKVGYRLCAADPSAGAVLPADTTAIATATAETATTDAAANGVVAMGAVTAELLHPRRSQSRWLAGGIAATAVLLAAAGFFMSSARHELPQSRMVLVQPLHVTPTDAPARRLAQDFASDLSRVVLGHDGRLEFADPQRSPETTDAFTVTGSVASVGKDLHAVVIVGRRDAPTILWSHDYTAPLADAEGLRQQVGTNVAAVLVCALGTDGVPEQAGSRIIALYLETCNLHAGDHRREIDLLRQVIARAPNFAGAWADLAISLTFASNDADASDAAVMRQEAHAAATHALSLNPHIGRAYFARALLLPGIRNWTARKRIIDAGLAAEPDCPQLYNIRAHDFAAIGRQADSIASNRRAVALDPLFPGKHAGLAGALADAGRLDDANDVVRHMREIWPDNAYTWFAAFDTAARIGDPREALALLDAMPARLLDEDEITAWRVVLQAREHPTKENVERAVVALVAERHRGVTDAQLVEDFALLGHPAKALDLALLMPPQADSSFWFRSFLQPLRADPRFMTIAARQGIYAVWRATGLWPDFCGDRGLRYDCRNAKFAAATSPQTAPPSPGSASPAA